MTGYGVDDGIDNQTRQTDSGDFLAVTVQGAAVTSVSADVSIKRVLVCGNDVGVQFNEMADDFWAVAQQDDIGEKNVDRILALALFARAQQSDVSYLNTAATVSEWCGMSDVLFFEQIMLEAE